MFKSLTKLFASVMLFPPTTLIPEQPKVPAFKFRMSETLFFSIVPEVAVPPASMPVVLRAAARV